MDSNAVTCRVLFFQTKKPQIGFRTSGLWPDVQVRSSQKEGRKQSVSASPKKGEQGPANDRGNGGNRKRKAMELLVLVPYAFHCA